MDFPAEGDATSPILSSSPEALKHAFTCILTLTCVLTLILTCIFSFIHTLTCILTFIFTLMLTLTCILTFILTLTHILTLTFILILTRTGVPPQHGHPGLAPTPQGSLGTWAPWGPANLPFHCS
ncbi:hypothetical protein llap_15080 [Limosa lapponica baueri]|uniref:Uncharacterized protein n=1 Tax=Limosa lapponica baueri TaxID=1758121 RepID=A0A2I0TLB1_LIMLA|nr:hypothetical protein llap_15080 [Limosa lapponica baueri]